MKENLKESKYNNKAPTQPKSEEFTPNFPKKVERSPLTFDKGKEKLTTLTGITTSQINQALKTDNPYPARVFLKVNNQDQDIPVFFRIKETPTYEGFIKENTGKYVNYSKCYNRERGNKCLYDDTEHCGECSNKLKQEFKNLES